jgi:acyl-coenzyme A thioesterase PaaI-like protein
MKSVVLQRKFNSIHSLKIFIRFEFFSNRFSCLGPCFTANLNIDYLKPLVVPAWVLVRAHIERHEGRKVYIHGTVENGEGVVYAKSIGLFIKPRLAVKEHIQETQENK